MADLMLTETEIGQLAIQLANGNTLEGEAESPWYPSGMVHVTYHADGKASWAMGIAPIPDETESYVFLKAEERGKRGLDGMLVCVRRTKGVTVVYVRGRWK